MSRVDGVSERRTGAPQAQQQTCDLTCAQEYLLTCTYLTVHQAMHYLQFSSENAVHWWANRRHLPKLRRGRVVLFLRRDLDEAVQPAQKGEPAGRRGPKLVRAHGGTA